MKAWPLLWLQKESPCFVEPLRGKSKFMKIYLETFAKFQLSQKVIHSRLV